MSTRPVASDNPARSAGAPGVGWYPRTGKRWLDFACAVAGLTVCLVPMGLLAVVSRLVDGGPVWFRQQRVGRHGSRFELLKFRSMRVRAAGDSSVTVEGDARVTPWGAFLRRWKLDELPQLFNVLRGDMSLVGPRPDVPGYLDRLQGEEAALLRIRPGITGPATLAFGQEEELLGRQSDPVAFNDQHLFPAKVRINLRYAEAISLWGDLGWVVATGLPRSFVYRRLLRNGWLEGISAEVRSALADLHAGPAGGGGSAPGDSRTVA